MLQSTRKKINTFFNNSHINFLNPITVQELQLFIDYFLSSPDSPFHSHNNNICKYPNIRYALSYTRSYIIFKDGKIIDDILDIPVFYCDNCKHYHAFLPHHFILPYSQYSIPFILCVLYDKKYTDMTVNQIVDKYQIAVSTLYRWIKRYNHYLTYYQHLRNKYRDELLKSLINHYSEILDDIFDICTHALFQLNRKLFNIPVYKYPIP